MPASSDHPPELRIALAMRGGVSLAVWMGGACSEIDSLRRAASQGSQPEPGTVGDTYRRLLEAVGYGSVAVDVVAGASAGGLNGALMGCSVVHGMRFDEQIRNLWLRLGDLGRLTRPVSARAEESPLDGDGEFYKPLATTLLDLTEESASRSAKGRRLDLSLTGTLLDGRASRRHQDLGPAILESQNRARFRFRHLPMPERLGLEGGGLSDFGMGQGREPALRRLAYAARSTSSFPGAFEPASVGYAEDSELPDTRPDIPRTHHGVFSESRPSGRARLGRDYVIDGGVLDNIPVAWAIRSIAAAPADRPVDRWLVYLQPLQFEEPSVRKDETSPVGPKETVERAKALRSGTETLSEDIDELERVRADSLRRGGFAQILEFALGQATAAEDEAEFLGKLFERALAGGRAYRQRLNVIEKDRVRRLWADPMPVLGVDLLGFTSLEQINSDAQSSADRSSLLADLRESQYDGVLAAQQVAGTGLEDMSLVERRDALCAIGRTLRTPQFLARTVALLLSSARALGDSCLDVKGALYDLRSEIELKIACHDRYLAAEPTLAGAAGSSANELVRRAAWRLCNQQLAAVPEWTTNVPADGWPEAVTKELLQGLVTQARALAAAAPPVDGPDDGDVRALVRCLLLAAQDSANAEATTEAVLVAVELLTGPLRPDPLAESAGIRFHMLSAANQSPLPSLRPDSPPLSVKDKLAGNQIGNFGAFLSARWRLNDWTWGRLDAAVSLVQVVVARSRTDESGRAAQQLRALADTGPDAPLEAVADVLVSRLHERILREELPLLADLDVAPPSRELLERSRPTDGPLNVEPLLAVGKESVAAILASNPSLLKVAVQLGLVAGQSWAVDSLQAAWTTVSDKAADTAADIGARAKTLGRALKDRVKDALPFL